MLSKTPLCSRNNVRAVIKSFRLFWYSKMIHWQSFRHRQCIKICTCTPIMSRCSNRVYGHYQDFLLHIELLSVLGFTNSAENSYGGVTHVLFPFTCWSLIDRRVVRIIRSFSSMLLSSTDVWPEVTRCWSLAIMAWTSCLMALSQLYLAVLTTFGKQAHQLFCRILFSRMETKQCNHWSLEMKK